MRLPTLLIAWAVAAGAGGCAAYAHATGGVASNLVGTAPAAVGGVLDLEYGGGVGSGTYAHPSMNFHLRVAEDLVQVAPSISLRGSLPALITPLYGVGLRVLSFEGNDGRFGFGMGSPFAQVGLFIGLRGDAGRLGRASLGAATGLVLHADTGYDLRFTSQPNGWWASVSVGYAVYEWAQ